MAEIDGREIVTLPFPEYESHARKRKKEIDDIKNLIFKCERINVRDLSKKDVEAIKECGKDVKEFHCRSVDAPTLIELLNAMPKLEKLVCDFYEVRGVDQVDVGLNVPNLKVLNIQCSLLSLAYEFFTRFLPRNSIVEHSSIMSWRDKKKDEKAETAIRLFFTSQKSIKKLSSSLDVTLKACDVLELEELEVEFNFNRLKFDSSILRSQPKLKILKFDDRVSEYGLSHLIDDICELSELEVLELSIQCVSLKHSKKLKKLKNLRELKIYSDGLDNFTLNFLTKKHPNLEKLKLGAITIAELLENVPNLTYLWTGLTSLKLNTFFKYLPKLEELSYRFEIKNSNFYELDTGIESSNLKKLDIFIDYGSFIDHVNEFLEVFDICPQLENFTAVFKNRDEYFGSTSQDLIEEKFFEGLNELEKLKNLHLSYIELKNFSTHFRHIADELKKLSRKVDRVFIVFMDKFKDGMDDFNYEPFVAMLRGTFDIVSNYELRNQYKNGCNLTIASGIDDYKEVEENSESEYDDDGEEEE